MWSWRRSRFKALDVIVIVLACAFLGIVLAHHHSVEAVRKHAGVPPIGPGSRLTALLPELRKSNQTLVMAMAVGCPYCEKSAPFYRKLAENSSLRAEVRLLAVLPESPAADSRYLEGLGVHVDNVVQLNLGRLGVVGIPTLALVGRTGIVSDVWYGELGPAEQARLLARLGGSSSGGGARTSSGAPAKDTVPDRISLQDIHRWQIRGVKFGIVDVQSRARFASSHLPGAVNIPLDEITVRAPVELSPSEVTVLDCTGIPYMACYFEARALRKLGFTHVSMLPSRAQR